MLLTNSAAEAFTLQARLPWRLPLVVHPADAVAALRRGDTLPGLGPQWLRVAARHEATTDALSLALTTALQELP